MCVIFLAIEQHKDHPLVLLANRDEFYERPTLAAGYWDDSPDVFAGRDLKGGGTWLGVTRNGRIAAVTNYREPGAAAGTRSRGKLVADFLQGSRPAGEYVSAVARDADAFSGFNLIVGEIGTGGTDLYYFSNRGNEVKRLGPGLYGLSNHQLDTPWPKVSKGKSRFAGLLAAPDLGQDECFRLLADEETAEDDALPSTGIPIEWERALSAIFIRTPAYGTRCSTVVRFDREAKWSFDERTFV